MLLATLRSVLVRAIETEFASQNIDLSFTQHLILEKLQELGVVSATVLARAVVLDSGAMTRQLDHLERKGYLGRAPHTQDRRALRLELTEAGHTKSRDMACISSGRVMTAAQRTLEVGERAQLRDYLERVLGLAV